MTSNTAAHPSLHWTEAEQTFSARWRSERQLSPPASVVMADDTMPANKAFRLASEGAALLWRGDFNNARHLLQAMARRVDRPPRNPPRLTSDTSDPTAYAAPQAAARAAFFAHREVQSRRAQLLGMLLIPLQADYGIPLRRAPDWRLACAQVWGEAPGDGDSVAPLRDLLGIVSAFEWRKNGVVVRALGTSPDDRIHPHHSVFSPVRGEYVQLVADAPWPAAGGAPQTAFDIGTGTGVLAAVLARRGVARVVATDNDARACACALDNLSRLVPAGRVRVLQAELFPPGCAQVVVCNPPWLPLAAVSALERAVYDQDSRMLRGFLEGLVDHLVPGGEGWLILSDLAEHLGLRSRADLLGWIAAAGLQVLGRLDTSPTHPKAFDRSDVLHAARAAEVTSLWRLGVC